MFDFLPVNGGERMISRKRAVWSALVISVCLTLLAGCGDTFRPTITAQNQPSGDPGVAGQAVVLASNPAGVGSDTHINTSGDTNVGVVAVGPNPVFLGKGTGRAFAINGNGTLTLYTAGLPQSATINTITLPASTSGPIGGNSSSNGTIYIANSGSNNVSVIPSSQLAVTNVLAVGTQPVMIAASGFAGAKVYSINHGSNDVSIINTADNSVNSTPIKVGLHPIWGVMTPDGSTVFVVNQDSGSVSVIDTGRDNGTITEIFLNGSGASATLQPTYAFYDPTLKRLYVTNTGDNSVSVIRADISPPVLLKTIPLSGSPSSVVALANGTKAYAALGGCPVGTSHFNLLAANEGGPRLPSCTGNRVSVIDVVGLRETKVITLNPPAFPATESGTISGTVFVAASNDSLRVYAVHANDTVTITDNVNNTPKPSRVIAVPNISIIRTSTDAEITDQNGNPLRINPPQQDPNCAAGIDATFNTKVPIPCATQLPFAIQVFP
jgi:YVTN family beta-propeller protein